MELKQKISEWARTEQHREVIKMIVFYDYDARAIQRSHNYNYATVYAQIFDLKELVAKHLGKSATEINLHNELRKVFVKEPKKDG